MILAEPLRVTAVVGAVLDRLEVPWLDGGSLASSIHGIPRATQDVDLVADLRLPHLVPFVAAMEQDFYCSDDAVRDAMRRRASFNVIHYATAMKVDIFMLKGDPLSRAEMDRRVFQLVGESDGVRLPIASPEDIILQKLDWYRRGDRVSDRQWRDVLGVLKVGAVTLDHAYLAAQAEACDLNTLLNEAIEAAKAR